MCKCSFNRKEGLRGEINNQGDKQMPIKTNIRRHLFIYTADFKAANKRSTQPKLTIEPCKQLFRKPQITLLNRKKGNLQCI